MKLSLKERLLKKMAGFEPVSRFENDMCNILSVAKDRIPREIFPVPILLNYLISSLLEFPAAPRFDKMHWCIFFRFRGDLCFLADEKFGLRLYHADSVKPDLVDVYRRINAALGLVETEVLAPAAEAALAANEIILKNCFGSLERRYKFFRAQAEKRKAEFLPPKNDHETQMLAHLFRCNPSSDSELAYYSFATIDAYFSRLEHFLTLALGFANFCPPKDDLRRFIGSNWGDKFRRVFPLSDPAAKRFYDCLYSLKEDFRNPLSHGGFEKGGASFSFHHKGVGVIPFVLSDISKSPQFNLLLGTHQTWETAVTLFDEFDSWLSGTSASKAWMYANSGLTMSFHSKLLIELNGFDLPTLESWISSTHERIAIYRNVEY